MEVHDGHIRVQLVFNQQQAGKQEVVKRVSKGHEVVEVDGFVFRRKRKAPPAQEEAEEADENQAGMAALAPALPPSAVKAGLALTPEKAPAMHTAADSTTEGPTDAAGDVLAPAAAAAAPPRDVLFSVAQDELTYLVQWLLTTELKKMEGVDSGQVAAAAAAITDRFAVALQQHLAHAPPVLAGQAAGDLGAAAGLDATQAAMAAAASQLPGLVALPYQVSKLKAMLQEKRDKLLQEEAAWLQLQERYGQSAAEQGEQQAPEQQAQAPSSAEQQEQSAAASGAAAAQGSGAEAAAPAAGQEVVAAAADDDDDGAAAGSPVPASPGQAAPGGPMCVAVTKRAALQSMALRVEGLCALVDKVEQLAANAEAAASKLQADFHQDKFKLFPHVNSPAYLIKSIVGSAAAE